MTVSFDPFTGRLISVPAPAVSDDTTNTIQSGTLNGNTITFTREDATTFTVDVTALYDDTNLVTSVNGNTGDITVQETLISGTNIKTVNGTSLLGSGNVDLSSFITTETDPVVGAVTGIVKADGAGNISAAVEGTDYSTFDGQFSSLTNTPTTVDGYDITDTIPYEKNVIFTDQVVHFKGYDFKIDDETGVPQIKLTASGDPGYNSLLADVAFSSYVILGGQPYAKSSGLNAITLSDTEWTDLTSWPMGNAGEHAQVIINSTQQGKVYRLTFVITTPGTFGYLFIEDLTN